MKFMIGAALVAFAAVSAPAIAQTAAPADAKPKGVRMACKQEAVTGSFTRKARQCRHAVGAPKRDAAAAKAAPTAPTTPTAPAQPATATAPATPPAAPATDVDPAGNDATLF